MVSGGASGSSLAAKPNALSGLDFRDYAPANPRPGSDSLLSPISVAFSRCGRAGPGAGGTAAKSLEGLGYYSRARNLQRAARIICDRFDGGCPTGYDDWLALPGVGPYTAGAVCSISLGLPVPAVDGNVLRVFSRLLALEEDIAAPAVKKELTALAAALIPPDAPGEYNQALMELGATVCLPNGTPLCQSCPISAAAARFKNKIRCFSR